MAHISVLEREAIESLNLKPDSLVVDCTLGSGGHSRGIVALLGPEGHLYAIDADPTAIKDNESLAADHTNTTLINGNFRNVKELLQNHNISAVDAILADLGWRTEQFDGTSGLPRGFSFTLDEPLHMTFGDPEEAIFTAYDIINDWEAEDIANVLYGYGEEQFSRRIAAAIVEARKERSVDSSKQLADIIYDAVPHFYRKKKIHPATKSFQALRIAVNDEFSALEELIQNGFELLAPQGRLSIITFHSLEDRIVKHTFKNLERDQKAVLVNKKPIAPESEELKDNPRARSAKLRTIEKV